MQLCFVFDFEVRWSASTKWLTPEEARLKKFYNLWFRVFSISVSTSIDSKKERHSMGRHRCLWEEEAAPHCLPWTHHCLQVNFLHMASKRVTRCSLD